ncbi:MAG: hypothetical protein CMM01_23305 [Rhodopirellula sp.]|nr:hypothetical protein [Rhodopirellula sp.]
MRLEAIFDGMRNRRSLKMLEAMEQLSSQPCVSLTAGRLKINRPASRQSADRALDESRRSKGNRELQRTRVGITAHRWLSGIARRKTSYT